MPNATQSDLEAARLAMKSGRPAKTAAPADRPLMWGAQAQVDRLANSFGPEVEVIAIPLADGGTAYEYRKARAQAQCAA